ncbi:LysE family translocator [Xanthobacteraceae bacterium Astr-EGSB]|uniref:LysE family translocator n=1 Tax=Astrobacterium formosum TaxID=3069710 RepID=UPI0027B32062|nr:LysE family translocator [Xanthobacteraceae bacterium Astr-EGSB]
MPLENFLAYVLASLVLVAIPGPSVTLFVANSLSHGVRAGLTTIAGSQCGLVLALIAVGIGLTSFMEAMGHWFEVLRFVGAAYLIWLGIKMLRTPVVDSAMATAAAPHGGFALQGFLVAISNPKTLAFFSAFLPQFLDPGGDKPTQIAIMGVTFLIIAGLGDASYALLAGRARTLMTGRRTQLMTRCGGAFIIGGGLWLAFARSR